MKPIIVLSLASLLIMACSSNTNKTGKADTVIAGDTLAKAKSLCFLRTDGKDSTSVELVIKGREVAGAMNWLPYQKDSRKGTLSGTIKGDTIQAKWSFMQEGINDTLNLKFKLNQNQLSQKPLKLNTKSGRDQTENRAGYTLHYASSNKLHQ